MTATPRGRRISGDGGVSEYQTQAGTRYRFECRLPIDPDDADLGTRRVVRGGFLTRKQAATEGRKLITGTSTTNGRQRGAETVAVFATRWLDGLDLAATTMAGYRKMMRLHVVPTLGTLTLPKVSPTRLAQLYRSLEASGRKDAKHLGDGLSAASVLKVHVLIGAMLDAAVADGLLIRNAARHPDARPPTPKTVRAERPEIHPWDAKEVRAFLSWAEQFDDRYVAWFTSVRTGVRRGELLGLQWRDIDHHKGVISVRRSVVLVKQFGGGETFIVKPPKSGRPRTVAVDAATIGLLLDWKRQRAAASLVLAGPESYVFGDPENRAQHPERFSRQFQRSIARCRASQLASAQDEAGRLGRPVDLSVVVREVRLHDLRHTHATLLLQAGVNPKVVQERLGHANISITLDVYSHVLPTMQANAADLLAEALG